MFKLFTYQMVNIDCWWFIVLLRFCLHRASLAAQTVKNPPAMRKTWVQSLVWEVPLEKKKQPTLVFLPGESHGQESWQATVHGVTKSQTELSN